MSEYRLRASSWGGLMDCALSWSKTHLEGMTRPSGPAAHLGTAVHAGTAVYDTARMNGQPIRPADAACYVVDALRNPEYPVDWSGEQHLTPKTAERIALALYSKYCADIAPHQDYAAVEMRCDDLPIEFDNGVVIVLTGTLDRIRRTPAGLGIVDLKSGACRVNSDGEVKASTDGPQLGQYELLATHTTAQPITAPAQIVGLNTRGQLNVGVAELHDCRQILVGDGFPGYLELAAQMLGTGLFPPNPKSTLCNPKYCANYERCPYHR